MISYRAFKLPLVEGCQYLQLPCCIVQESSVGPVVGAVFTEFLGRILVCAELGVASTRQLQPPASASALEKASG